VFDDVRALAVETDVPAQVIVDPLVRQRAQEDDERKRRPQQLGTEDRGPIEDVEGLQLRGDGLGPRPLIATACSIELATRPAYGNVAVSARGGRIIRCQQAES